MIHPTSLGLAAWLLASLPAIGVAEESASVPAVEAGREALRDTGSYPWYDSDADEVRRIDAKPPKAKRSSASSWNWFGGGDWFTPIAWIIVAALLSGVVYLLVRAYLAREQNGAMTQDEAAESGVTDDLDRVEDLPMPIRRPTSDLLSEARRQYEAGNYAEAIIYLYSHQLVQLDRHQMIRLAKGKTNRQYLREIASRGGLRRLLETTMVLFEHVFFGKHPLDRVRFESAWDGIDEFDRLLEQRTA